MAVYQPARQTQLPVTGKVGVVIIDKPPEMKLEGFGPRSKGEGAARGAGAGFYAGASTGNPLLFLLVSLIAVPVTTITGAAIAPAADEVKHAEEKWGKQFSYTALQKNFRDQLVDSALANFSSWQPVTLDLVKPQDKENQYDKLAAAGIDHVLELTITRIGAEGSDFDSPFALQMHAQAQLLQTRDAKVIRETEVEYRGESRLRSEWAANNGRLMWNGVVAGTDGMAKQIYENLFMLYRFPDQSWHSTFPRGYLGLAAIEPATGNHFLIQKSATNKPVFRWESFPRKQDIELAADDMKRVRNVRYDFFIAEESDCQTEVMAPCINSKMILQRNGISATEYKLPQALRHNMRYIWSVRARFELDGRDRVTEWSGEGGGPAPGLNTGAVPPLGNAYQFKTP